MAEILRIDYPSYTKKLNHIHCNNAAVFAVFDEQEYGSTLFASPRQSNLTSTSATLGSLCDLTISLHL